jgi:hypothetical protein
MVGHMDMAIDELFRRIDKYIEAEKEVERK